VKRKEYTGGTSISDPTAGQNGSAGIDPLLTPATGPATRADKAGAWFLTALIILASTASCYFLLSLTFEHTPSR
jgi:hypothetical protein